MAKYNEKELADTSKFLFCPPTQTGGDWYRTGP